MKALLLSLFLLLAAGGGKGEDPVITDIRTHPFRIANYFGDVGHGCPVVYGTKGPVVFTSRHIVDRPGDEYDVDQMRWSDEESAGVIGNAQISRSVDLAALAFLGDPPKRVYKIRQDRPAVGEKVYIWGMQSEDGKPWEDNFIETEIIAVRTGIITTKRSPGLGSSGSCVFDAQGRVIGIKMAVRQEQGILKEGRIVGLERAYINLPEEKEAQ